MILKVIYGSEMNFLVCNVERYVVLFFFNNFYWGLGSIILEIDGFGKSTWV
jgi:hypothetical protein